MHSIMMCAGSTGAEEQLGRLLERGRLDSSDEPQKPEDVRFKPSPRKAISISLQIMQEVG